MESESECLLLQLSDCVMLEILSYLDATTLYNLSKTCIYFKNIIVDPSLWKFIDARDEPNSDDKTDFCISQINERTKKILFRAKNKSDNLRARTRIGNVPYTFFRDIEQYENITVLALENQRLNGHKVSMKIFPKGLRELSLKKTYIKNSMNFFRFSHHHREHLRVLILDDADWVSARIFMSIAKYTNLEILSAIKCMKLARDAVPMLTLASMRGCSNLKIFDCRFTPLGEELIAIIHKLPALLAVYFTYSKAYCVDYPNRAKGEQKLGSSKMCVKYDNHISDRTVFTLMHVRPVDGDSTMPESVLYTDPYKECKCKNNPKLRNQVDKIPDDVYIPNFLKTGRPGNKMLCRKHRRKMKDSPTIQNLLRVVGDPEFSDSSEEDENGSSDSSSEDIECCLLGETFRSEQQQRGWPVNCIVVQTKNRPNENSICFPTSVSTNNNNDIPSVPKEVNGEAVKLVGGRDDQPGTSSSSPQNGKTKRKAEDPPDDAPETNDSRTSSSKIEISTPELKKADSDDENKQTDIKPHSHKSPSKKRKRNDVKEDIDRTPRYVEMIKFLQSPVKEEEESSEEMSGAERRATKYYSGRLQAGGSKYLSSSNDSDDSDEPYRGPGPSRMSRKTRRRLSPRPTTISEDIETPRDPPRESDNQDPMLDQPVDNYNPLMRFRSTLSNLAAQRYAATEKRSPEDDGNELAPKRIRIFNAEPPCRTISVSFPRHFACRFPYRNPKHKTKLKRLSLRGFKDITNYTLLNIQQLNIELLDLTYTNVTEEGIEDFLTHNPNCRIVHPKYCVCLPDLPDLL